MAKLALSHDLSAISHTEPLNGLLARIRGEIAVMCEETDRAVQAELPELIERADVSVRYPVIEATFRRALRRFEGHSGPDPEAPTHRAFGAAAAYAGVSVEQLAAGYRVGARIGWAHIRVAARELGVGADLALLLADAQITYIHEVTADSLDGYAEAARSVHDHQSRERQALLDALMAGHATKSAAASAGWPWPNKLAVAVIHDGDREAEPSPDVLIGIADSATIALGTPSALDFVLARVGSAAIGPTVTPANARQSFERARRLANLVTVGVLKRDGIVRWADELASLIVHSAPDAAEELAAIRLAPLRDPSPGREEMLRETLLGWLDHPGQPLAIARALQLHPQSVRYRLTRLRDRLGDSLDDPNARFELSLALRYRGFPATNRG